jgi:hypothetical protein
MKTKFATLEQLKANELNQYYGTEDYHRTNLFVPYVWHTDGIEAFAEQAECYWLLDILATEFADVLTKTKRPDKFYIEIICTEPNIARMRNVTITMTDYEDEILYTAKRKSPSLLTGRLNIRIGWDGTRVILCLPSED